MNVYHEYPDDHDDEIQPFGLSVGREVFFMIVFLSDPFFIL